MFSRWEKGFVEEEPNAICKDCVKEEEEEEDRLCPCGDGYKESGCPDGCSGGCCISCCGVGEDEVCCCKCDEVVPIKYLNGKAKDEKWIECSCGAHDGWYCPDCSPGNDCWDDQDCDCCNPGWDLN